MIKLHQISRCRQVACVCPAAAFGSSGVTFFFSSRPFFSEISACTLAKFLHLPFFHAFHTYVKMSWERNHNFEFIIIRQDYLVDQFCAVGEPNPSTKG
jgi:hypothetical protein